MVSSEDEELAARKRKVPRACDGCRRKKIRCVFDFATLRLNHTLRNVPGDKATVMADACSNCVIAEIPCTFLESAKKRGPSKSYVQSLERRVKELEDLLRTTEPGRSPLGSSITALQINVSTNQLINHLKDNRGCESSVNDGDKPDDEDEGSLSQGYVGKASQVALIQRAMSTEDPLRKVNLLNKQELSKQRRSKSPSATAWAKSPPLVKSKYTFPEPEYMETLIKAYFEQLNCLIPLLHQPTFRRHMKEGLHLHDIDFGGTVLLVCALGTRNTEDPRVFYSNTRERNGSEWADQVQVIERSKIPSPSLYIIQCYCLSVLYMYASSTPQSAWNIAGFGLRVSQNMGLHRKKSYRVPNTVEDELLRRAFWVLVIIDRHASAALGRPTAMHIEDIDALYPTECDDEYWIENDQRPSFKQPPGLPSIVTCFVQGIKISEIMAVTLRTVYALNRSRVSSGSKPDVWIVKELDDALKRFKDELPSHLKWKAQFAKDIFFTQSVSLYVYYYSVQILVHRPSILSSQKVLEQDVSSLQICTNAARSCSNLLNEHSQRGSMFNPSFMAPAFNAGVVNLLNAWGEKKAGNTAELARNLAEYQNCMNALRQGESRWFPARKLWKLLEELYVFGEKTIHASTARSEAKPGVSPDIEKYRDQPIEKLLRAQPEIQQLGADPLPSSQVSLFHSPININDPQPRSAQAQMHALHLPQYAPYDFAMTTPPMSTLPGSSAMSLNDSLNLSLPALSQNFTPVQSTPVLLTSENRPITSTDAYSPNEEHYITRFLNEGSSSRQPTVSSHSSQVWDGVYGDNNIQNLSDVVMGANQDTLALWKTAPSGFEINDWGAYMSGPHVFNNPFLHSDIFNDHQESASPSPRYFTDQYQQANFEHTVHPFYGR